MRRGVILRVGYRAASRHAGRHSDVNCAKTAEPVDFAVWVVDSGWPKEAQVQSYSPGGTSAPSWEGTLAPHGEYD